ncbi:hypothetical protein PJ985_17700 [Streptomyces sp. ACA25]|uniref:hypothetical protein n=1 Tax=Streptomyces sp. ACA25 TaxID=3022596 RepID=UPI0023078737|nr:hypothetical protein [Streptomyces sp. ACA25]MDB1089400.1 hypothetical protein [Streptomyces sp. ACA25]
MTEQQDTAAGGLTVRIGQAVMLHRAGDREEARNRLAQLWEEAGKSGDGFHRCTIAHYLADTQDDPDDELRWDLRALAEADALTGERVPSGGYRPAVRAFYPALYLSIAADRLKLGDAEAARRELGRARRAVEALGRDACGAGVRAAIERLDARLAGGPGTPGGTAG